MKRLFQLFTILLALAWLPIATHCSWEGLIAGDLFKCDTGTAQKGDCSEDGDGCVAVESGSYKVPDTAPEVPTPLFAVVLFELPVVVPNLSEQAAPHTAAPAEVPVSWQFVARTALPPRAPSLS